MDLKSMSKAGIITRAELRAISHGKKAIKNGHICHRDTKMVDGKLIVRHRQIRRLKDG
jgi:hypothetical protein